MRRLVVLLAAPVLGFVHYAATRRRVPPPPPDSLLFAATTTTTTTPTMATPPPRRPPLERLEEFVQQERSGVDSSVKEEFDAMVAALPSAVDAVRVLDMDLPSGFVSTSTYAAALEAISARAPAAASGALVGHVIARLKRRPDAAEACMDDRVLSPLASALVKARQNQQVLTAIDAISGEKNARDYRSGIIAAARLKDANKVRILMSSALKKEKLRNGEYRKKKITLVEDPDAIDDVDAEKTTPESPGSSSDLEAAAAEGASAAAKAVTPTPSTPTPDNKSSGGGVIKSAPPPPPVSPLSKLDEGTLRFALKVLAKNGDYRTPFSVIEGLPLDKRSPALYHAAISACSKARPPKGKTAMLLWKKMKTHGFRDQIPRATYNALLHCAQGAAPDDTDNHGDLANANATTAILREMKDRGISLNVVSYNIALHSLADGGRFQEILDLLDRMEKTNVAPTAVTFGTAIHGAARANNSQAALALLKADVKHCKETPGDAAFGAALEACVRDPDASQAAAAAQDVLNIMCDLQVDLQSGRERIELLAREALHRGVLDEDRVNRAERALQLNLHNRQLAV